MAATVAAIVGALATTAGAVGSMSQRQPTASC